MKREIKFRVYDSISKMIHTWWRVKKIGFLAFDLEHYTLMQYTELKDKNGVEIYEGDIVSYIPSKKFIVFYQPGSFTAHRIKKDGSIQKGGNLLIQLTNLEVIGNIYENPELLNKTT